MNSFINHNKQFFSLLLGLLLNSSLHAITFRNQPLSNFIKPGEFLYATFPENSFVMLQMEGDNFDMIDGDIESLDNLKEIFQEAMANRFGMSISSRECNLSSNIANYTSASLGGTERMNIEGRTSLMFTRCFLKSPFISIKGHVMEFADSFLINPEILNIILDYPGSDLKMIQIIFHDQPGNPTVITGGIDLKDNQTRKTLTISNVKEIRMQFRGGKSLPKDPRAQLESSRIDDFIDESKKDDMLVDSYESALSEIVNLVSINESNIQNLLKNISDNLENRIKRIESVKGKKIDGEAIKLSFNCTCLGLITSYPIYSFYKNCYCAYSYKIDERILLFAGLCMGSLIPLTSFALAIALIHQGLNLHYDDMYLEKYQCMLDITNRFQNNLKGNRLI